MKDRYLFKAKRLDNGEWVQGVPFEIEGKTVILIKDNENLLRTHYLEENMWTAEIYAIEVDPPTICQCIGLSDKNGELIWENDIVWDSDERVFNEIIWNQEDMCWNVEDADGHKFEFEECYGSTIEVNGSRFDNPELLESEE